VLINSYLSMQLPSTKASDDEEDEQKHVVAPLHTAEGEEADDDEEEEQDKADTSMNSQDGDQGHGVVEPIQIPTVEHNEQVAAAKLSVVDVKTVVVAEVVEAVVEETADMMVQDKEESVSIEDKINEKELVEEMHQNSHEAAVAHMSSKELQGDAPTKPAATPADVPKRLVLYPRVVQDVVLMFLGGGCPSCSLLPNACDQQHQS
jgi:hypothetical protein